MRRLLPGLLILCFASSARAQSFDLTIANIMRGPELVGEAPQDVHFTDDSRWIFFRWKPGGLPWDAELSWYRVAARGGAPEKLTARMADSLGVLVANGSKSADGRWRVVSYQDDLYIIDRSTLAVQRLTDTGTAELDPVFGRDGRTIYFVRDDNVYAFSRSNGAVAQLTDLRAGPAPDSLVSTAQRKFLEQQQLELFAHLRREAAARARADSLQHQHDALAPSKVYLLGGEHIAQIAAEPNGNFAIVRTERSATGARTVDIPEWITRSGYTETIQSRTKVGDIQRRIGRTGIIDLHSGDVQWIDVAITRDSVDASLAAVTFLGWNVEGSNALIGASSTDFKDEWLLALNAETGRLTRLAHEHNNAWIGGPCDFWSGCAGWLPDDRVFYASEKDGYSHIYLIDRDGTDEHQITHGNWEVYSVSLAPTRDRLYITTNEGTPAEQHFYHLAFDGRRTRITNLRGHQSVSWSNDGKRIAAVHSFANTPPELYVGDNRQDAPLTRVTTSPTREWSSYRWIAPPIIRVPARDGADIPARIYRPAEFGVTANGAGIIFVHGAGYLQNVHDWWSYYYREYMFHHFLATRGYTIIDVDYRGSQGYGRDWRTAIYRHMGGQDLSDQVDAAAYLVAHENVDPKRIGIYGGSYGGFITLMALFTQGDHFAAGAALRAVTDWAHYNHGYTARILNTPQQDTIAYQQSSPIYFAEGLHSALLMAHGMVDTNVHFSDVVRLSQRLIELGKTDWELAVYPVESHDFVEPASWTDEYRRIFELFERNLR